MPPLAPSQRQVRIIPTQVAERSGHWRVVNPMAAWRDQLLEVMGAMGIREARRMRSESGVAAHAAE